MDLDEHKNCRLGFFGFVELKIVASAAGAAARLLPMSACGLWIQSRVVLLSSSQH